MLVAIRPGLVDMRPHLISVRPKEYTDGDRGRGVPYRVASCSLAVPGPWRNLEKKCSAYCFCVIINV